MAEPTQVLHLITRFMRGGAERTTENTLYALQKSDGDYDLRLGFGAGYDREHVRGIANRGIDTVCFRSIRHYNPVTQVVAVLAVARYLRREDIDVLHTHSTEAGIVGRCAGWLAGTPVVVHEIHGDPIAEDRNAVLNWGVTCLERVATRMSTRLIVKSEVIRDTYLDRGIGERSQYELIYHGVDVDRFEGVEPVKLPTSADTTLLFVGRLEDGKGLFDLLEAFEELRERHSVSLLIAGEGKQAGKLRTEINERGIDGVSLLGYRGDILELMAAADILVLPSYREGTPRVITEALASGLPVVSTSVAGIPEQVEDGETGYLIEPGAVEHLEARLSELIANEDARREMAERASDGVEKFSLGNARREYRQLYQELSELAASDVID